MRIRIFIALLVALVLVAPAYAKTPLLRLTVSDPYLELHTGPGRGFPVFHVVDRGAEVEVVRRRTDWFQLRTDRGIEGWVEERQLARTLTVDGAPPQVARPAWDDFTRRRWEMSVSLGDFDGASSISVTAGYRFSPNLSAELLAAHISGDFSDGWLAGARLLHTLVPEWRFAPYVFLGTGALHVSPRSSLVTTEDRTDQYAQAGLGLRTWLTRNFMLRAEYAGYVAFTSRDENEEVEEWKAGFAFFF
jgi:uncharacterized protein YgiM (DUF1202 family)